MILHQALEIVTSKFDTKAVVNSHYPLNTFANQHYRSQNHVHI